MQFENLNKFLPFSWTIIGFTAAIIIAIVQYRITNEIHWPSIQYYAPAIISGGALFDIKMNFKVKDLEIVSLKLKNKELEIENINLKKKDQN